MAIDSKTGQKILAEDPDIAQKEALADMEYAELKLRPLDLDGAKNLMGGIGAISIETGKKNQEKAKKDEISEENEPDIDFSAFDVAPA